MTQLAERMASGGWPALNGMDGEPVTYDRVVAGESVTGFPKSFNVLFSVDNRTRREYQDGRGDLSVAVVLIRVSDIGDMPKAALDRITRGDGTIWTIEDLRGVVGGLAKVEAVNYAAVSKSSRQGRIER